MMTIDEIGTALHGKRNGKGWMVCCPAHEDVNPSLSINEGNDGRILVKCFAGCTQESVIVALKGLGYWPGTVQSDVSQSIKPRPAPLPQLIENELGMPPVGTPAPDMGNASLTWCYRDFTGSPLFYIARFDSLHGKQFVPFSWDLRTSTWVKRAWPAPRPLYGLEELAKNPTKIVLICEGEKAADAARQIVGDRFAVLSWPNGAQAVDKADWTPLYGRKILLWPDADEPGLLAARGISDRLVSHCPEVKLIELDLACSDPFSAMTGFDAADALALGWDWNALVAWAKPKIKILETKPTISQKTEGADELRFESVAESLDAAEVARNHARGMRCPTGIRFLDKALGGGIGVSDVMLLAAPTGAGKTELALSIAIHNAIAGRRVHVFALEADRYELTQRLFYRELATLYFQSTTYRQEMIGKKFNFADWMDGKYGDVLKDLEQQASKIVGDKYKTLNVFYRGREFGIEEFTQQVLAVKDQTDLVLLDHAGYIDLSENLSENRAMTDLIKAIRDMALISQKPFVVVSHIRKKDSRSKALLPDLDDIHGTSNLAKICTKAVMMAPCYEPTQRQGEFFTYLRVAKNRRDGSRCRFTAVCTFDAFQNCYKDEFILGRLVKDGQEFEPLKPDDMPHWVKD